MDRRLQPYSPWGLVGLTVLAALLPLVVTSSYHLGILVVVGLYALVGTGLGLLMGHAGQVSLGQAGFYGIGAYTAAILSANHGWNPWLGLLAGMVLAGVVAYAVGLLTLRLQGHYLALATLGFGIIVFILFVEAVRLTGGPSGLVGIPLLRIGGLKIHNDLRFFYLVWTLVLLGLMVYRNVLGSRVGRALRAVHGSEYAAAALGVDVWVYKLQVFVLSAVYAALAGGIYAYWVGFISPTAFGLGISIEFLIIGVVGGLTSLWGPVLGAFVVVVLHQVLKEVVPRLLPGAGGEYEIMVYGVLLVLMLIYLPRGVGGLLDRWAERRRSA